MIIFLVLCIVNVSTNWKKKDFTKIFLIKHKFIYCMSFDCILFNIAQYSFKKKKERSIFVFHNMMFWIIFGIRGYRNQDVLFYIANRQFEENLLKLVLAD